jgi:hypothetical protein
MRGNPSSAAPYVFNPYYFSGPSGSSATNSAATAVTSAGGPWVLNGVPIAAWRINMNTYGASTPTVVKFQQAGIKQ